MLNNVLHLIGPKKKKKLIALIVMMFFGSLLEMLGIAMIMEACSFLTSMDTVGSQTLREIFHLAGVRSDQATVSACLIGLIALYLLKMIYLLLENRLLAQFVCGVQHETSVRLYTGILRKPYSWFVRVSTPEIINLLNADTSRAGAYLDAFLDFASEALVLAVIGAALTFVSPVMTLCLLLGAGLSLFLTRGVIRPSSYRTGKMRQTANIQRLKWMKQGVLGIKDVKTLQAEDHFSSHYEKEDSVVANCDSRQRALTRVPGLCIEAIMAISVLIYILSLSFTGQNLADSLPDLSALAAAAIRLLPAVRRISGNLIRMSNMKTSMETLTAALEHIPEEAGEPADGQREADLSKDITASHITFSYESRPEPVLADISIKIPAGSSIGITGPSGIGKTTLIDIMLGLLEPQKGCVCVGDTDIRLCRGSYLRQSAYIPQNIFLLDDTIRGNIAFCASANIDENAVWTALREASLEEFVKKLPDGLDTLVGENGIRLSGGERQRLGIARALYRGARFIIFDEATSALDPDTEAAVIQSIQSLQGKVTMIIISHRASAVSMCDRIYHIEEEDGRMRLLSL